MGVCDLEKKVKTLLTKDTVLQSRREYLISQTTLHTMREILQKVANAMEGSPQALTCPDWMSVYAEIQLVLHEKTLAIEKLEWTERLLVVAKRYVEALCRVRELDYDEGESDVFTLRMEAMAKAETELFDTLATVLALSPFSYEDQK
jgi:hypothetical protein